MNNFKNIKLISCDLDGTILNFNGKPSEKTIAAINELHARNYILVACSGRPLHSVPKEIYDLPFDYIIGNNGQEFLDRRSNETFEKEKLHKDELEMLHNLAIKHMCISNIHYEGFTYLIMAKRHLLFGIGFNVLNSMRFVFKQRKKSKVKYSTNIKSLNLEDNAKICFVSFASNLRSLQKEIDTNKKYHSFLVAKNWLEAQPIHISKGQALIDIAKRENIDIENTMAFGDGENDYPMLKAAGIGVAMENGLDKTKSVAQYIAPSFLNDGFASFVSENLLEN